MFGNTVDPGHFAKFSKRAELLEENNYQNYEIESNDK